MWPLAIVSMGESWHNLHHADPTCARHGVQRGQIDMSARIIWVFEKLGWAHDVRWPTPTGWPGSARARRYDRRALSALRRLCPAAVSSELPTRRGSTGLWV